MDGEGDIPEVGAVAQPLPTEDFAAQLLVLVQVLGAHVVAHHEPGQVGGGHLGHRPAATMLPSRSTVYRLQTSMTSLSLWEMKTMATFCF